MRLIKFLYVFLLISGSALANQPILEVKAEGHHVAVQHVKDNRQLQDIKLCKHPKKPLIQDTKSLIQRNSKTISEIFTPMDREIDPNKLWARLKENPFLLFVECDDPECPLTRAINPKPRATFEQKVLKAVAENKKRGDDSKLHLTFFGSSYLYDTLVHVSQILQENPNLKSLEIDLVDNLYFEYIKYIQENKNQNLPYLKFDQIDKQNWFNVTTIRFAIFSSILEEIAPNTNISLRISGSLSHLSQDQVSGSVNSTPNILIAGDLFDPGGGACAFHDFIVYGARASNQGAIFLILSRDERPGKTHQITELVKRTSAEHSREELEKVTYDEKDDWFNKMGKRLNCAYLQFEECK